MKKIIFALLLLFTTTHAYSEQIENVDSLKIESDSLKGVDMQSDTELWDAANTAYIRSDYSGALRIYDAIAKRGLESSKLYYNMGNAYYKSNELGRAILYYNRALELSPSDEDIRHNLKIAQSKCVDRIESIPEFFLRRWFGALRSIMSGNSWCIVSLLMLALTIFGVILYLLSPRMVLRKVGFFSTIATLLLLILSTSFAAKSRRESLERNRAVILSGAVSVKSSPSNTATDLFVLHEGTELTLGESVGNWYEIRLADGKKGWVEMKHFETI